MNEVAEYASTLPYVESAHEYKFMCSDPGQQMLIDDAREKGLNRVVVASCSPRMHEKTFRKASQTAGINPYCFQMACIREHCSWVTEDPEKATEKAKDLVRGAVSRVLHHEMLTAGVADVNPNVLVIGAGIAGMQAALDIAYAGMKVYLVEREPTIGGTMLKFDKTFPTLDCAACIGTPKLVSVGQDPNIEMYTNSEVAEVTGFVGNFNVKIRRKPRHVDLQKCTGCGECTAVVLDEDRPPKKSEGELWVDRIQIDEARCSQCGECVRACMEDNAEIQGLTNIVRQRFQAVSSRNELADPTPLQKILLMSQEERKTFWGDHFRKCIKCYGCIDMCPVFVGWDDGLQISQWMEGGQVPPPYPLFHLLRAYNVWDTCVGCGECEKTCPADIPLKMLQDIIRYLPVEDVVETIPGLEAEALEKISSFVEKRRESSRRISYAS